MVNDDDKREDETEVTATVRSGEDSPAGPRSPRSEADIAKQAYQDILVCLKGHFSDNPRKNWTKEELIRILDGIGRRVEVELN